MEKTPKMLLPSHVIKEIREYMTTGLSDYDKLIIGLQTGECVMLDKCGKPKSGKGKGKGK